MQRSAPQPRHGLRRLGQACLFQQRVMRPPLGCSKGMPDSHLSQAPPPVADHLPNDTCKSNLDLAAVVEAWPELPEAIKAGILAMVNSVGKKQTLVGQEGP